MKNPPAFLFVFFSWLLKYYILILGLTSRLKILHVERFKQLSDANQPIIFAFWHKNLVLPPYFYFYGVKTRRKLVSLVSRSHDGEIIAQILHRFNGITVRGSSSKGGAASLKKLAQKVVDEGYDVAMIPDGPRGPAGVVQPGTVKLAQLTGAPILPLGLEMKRKYRLRSWDRMKVPYWFNRLVVSAEEPLYVPRHFEQGEQEQFQTVLRARLATACEEAEKACFEK